MGTARAVHRVMSVVASAVFVAGCAGKAPPPVAPPTRAGVRYVLGSPVDPPAAGQAAGGDVLVVRMLGYAANEAALPAGVPLAAGGRLIVDSANVPVSIAPPGAEEIRLLSDVSALPAPRTSGRGAVAVQELRSPVPPGCTAVFSFVPALPAGGEEAARV